MHSHTKWEFQTGLSLRLLFFIPNPKSWVYIVLADQTKSGSPIFKTNINDPDLGHDPDRDFKKDPN